MYFFVQMVNEPKNCFKSSNKQLSNSKALYGQIFSLPNVPEMRLVSDDQLSKQIAYIIEASEKASFNGYS